LLAVRRVHDGAIFFTMTMENERKLTLSAESYGESHLLGDGFAAVQCRVFVALAHGVTFHFSHANANLLDFSVFLVFVMFSA
jgi:hypothetical protein